MTSEEIRQEMSAEQDAFQLTTICAFILARTPMVAGYAPHNEVLGSIQALVGMIKQENKFNTEDTSRVAASIEWQRIAAILGISI